MKNKSVKQVMQEVIQSSDYDGLYNSDIECGCLLADLFACGEPSEHCQLGYNDPVKAQEHGGSDTWVGPNNPEQVMYNAQECPITVCKGGPLVEAVKNGVPGWQCTKCECWFTWEMFMEAGWVRTREQRAESVANQVRGEVPVQNKAPIVICGFPGVGKTYASVKWGWQDSDSSQFSWTHSAEGVKMIPKRVRHPDWPQNYIHYIKRQTGVVMCSTHAEVRDALVEANIPFYLVFPQLSLMHEYVERYRRRGSPESFITLLKEQWEDWVYDMENESRHDGRICLGSGEFIDSAAWHFPRMQDLPCRHCGEALGAGSSLRTSEGCQRA